MKVLRCLTCGPKQKKFTVIARVTQEWLVDQDGEFLRCTNDCEEVTHRPRIDSNDFHYSCAKCGAGAVVCEVKS